MTLFLAQAADPASLTSVQGFLSFIAAHWQFCLLHFLQFAIWGAWIVVLGNLLNARGFSRKEIGRIYGTMPIGSMISPLIIGPLADKYFNTEVLIGISHLIGAALLFVMARATNPRPFYWAALFYALAYSPTLSLANSIVFAHDADIFNGMAEQRFPWIRVFGTIGWIAAGLSLALLLRKDQPVNERPLLLACVLSVILGLYAFTLPETKPGGASESASADTVAAVQSDVPVTADMAVAPDAGDGWFANAYQAMADVVIGSIQMLTEHPVFFAVTFIASMAMGLYFAFAALYIEKKGVPANTVGPVMTIGQWIEIFFIVTLPVFLGDQNEHINRVLMIGICAWAVRFAFFAAGQPIALLMLGIALHGVCFDFFFVAGFINTNMIAPEGLTATAQTFYGFLVYGLGMYLGSEGSGWLNQYFSKTITNEQGEQETITNWRAFWAIPAAIVGVAALMFWISGGGA